MKSILYRDTMNLMRNIAETRQENRTDASTDPTVNKAEATLNTLLTILVTNLEKCDKVEKEMPWLCGK